MFATGNAIVGAIGGGFGPVLLRALSVTALLSVFGTLTFRCGVLARIAVEPAVDARLRRLTWASVAAGMAATCGWLVVQAADMAGTVSVSAVARVLSGTAFGHLIAWQLAVLAGVALLLGRNWPRAALAAAAVATALQAGHGHAASMTAGPSLLLACDVVHLLGAGAWLGGLWPLWLVVRDTPPRQAAAAARWFSPLGKLCVVALAGSAVVQGWVLVDSVPGLVGTAYGWMACAKLGLMGVLVGFACLNRYRLAPGLLRYDPAAAQRGLLRSIGVQTGFGLLILLAAAVLSSLSPAMHVQPTWPFPQRFTLDTINEDPGFRNEVLGALAALAGAGILLVLTALLRWRVRWLLPLGALTLGWFAVPHLDLLFVPAYPTSYYRSPTDFAATAILQGAALYPDHCAACHGTSGRGDGPAAAGLPEPPADLTAAHLWMHSDGELFWWLSHGIPAPDGRPAMPGFAGVLSDDDRWHLIDYIRAHNAGLTYATSGAWSPPVAAPGLQARCEGGRSMSLADLRGGYVRLVFGGAPVDAARDVTTILITTDPAATPRPGVCVADDANLPRAYAILIGLPDTIPAGVQVLVDAAGWLRAMQRGGWNDPRALSAELHLLDTQPINMPSGMCNAHMQM